MQTKATLLALLCFALSACQSDLVDKVGALIQPALQASEPVRTPTPRETRTRLLSELPRPSAVPLDRITTGAMQAPARIAVSDAGRIAVSDPAAHTVHIFEPNGDPGPSVELKHPLAVAFDRRGMLFVGDAVDRAVYRFDALGRRAGRLGDDSGQIQLPSDMAYDPEADTLHVTDGHAVTVAVFTSDGGFVRNYGSSMARDGGLTLPVGIAVDPQKGLSYVVDYPSAKIHVFDREGRWLRALGGHGTLPGLFGEPHGLARDPEGRLFVVDTHRASVRVVDDNGLHVGDLGPFGEARGRLVRPMDAALTGDGRLFVTSKGTADIALFELLDNDGTPSAP